MKDFMQFKDEFDKDMGLFGTFSQLSTDEPPTTAKKIKIPKVIPPPTQPPKQPAVG